MHSIYDEIKMSVHSLKPLNEQRAVFSQVMYQLNSQLIHCQGSFNKISHGYISFMRLHCDASSNWLKR